MKILQAKIIKNIEVMPNYYKMILEAPGISRQAKPGQFINVLVSDKHAPLLRRPFSIHNIKDSKIEILYEIVGKGTEILSRKKAGEKINIIGPLGNGFDFSGLKRQAIVVAGGMGIAPLIFLAKKLKSNKTIVFIGAKNKRQILCEDELKNIGCEVKIATDDGSLGFKGLITKLLKRDLPKIKKRPLTIFACGPKPMLKEIVSISKHYHIPAQLSLEEHMACGIGACFGCVVLTKDGYKRVCKEGPVFNGSDIKI